MPVSVLRRPSTLSKISALPDRVRAGVAVKGEAAAYAEVWEWGSLRIRKPGPKTTYGANPDAQAGDGNIFTTYAPSGYVRIHKDQFFAMARAAVSTVPMTSIQSETFLDEVQQNLNRIATESAQIMAQDAPIDTGLLKESIVAVEGDEVVELIRQSYRPLIIGDPSDG